ncbi:MAG: virulence RhuM family protein [bacterium]
MKLIFREEPGSSQLILYQTDDGRTKLQVRLDRETVWLSQNQLAELFQTTKQNVSLHIKNVFSEGELREDAVVKDFLTTASDGKNYQTRHYNLDVIISVGYRVKSLRGTQFRIWATQRLREYIVKGFTLDDDRLKQVGGGGYFDELLARIRDVRSSEKVFYKKILEIYATSVDYDPRAEATKQFFASVQNKMHWAVHGQTAAEVVHSRADASKPNMGITNWSGDRIRRDEVAIAKNYLTPNELEALNLIVSAYLDFAELQALNRRVVHMADWIAKLDDFLKLSERDILTHAGRISHEQALQKAEAEFDKFHALKANEPSPVEKDFEEAVAKIKKLAGGRKNRKLPKKK